MTNIANSIEHVAGFRAAGVHAGLKADNQLDFALILSDRPCTASAVFTTNEVKAAPLLVCMDHLSTHGDQIRAVAINTKSANALTGEPGMDDSRRMAGLVAEAANIDARETMVLSTGVIGTRLNLEKIANGVTLATDALGDDWEAAASAIMTTDTHPKTCAVTVTRPGGQTYTVAGIAKGAGMIAPNMATMLGVIVTDAQMRRADMDEALQLATSHTFNRIVVDGDMSTNDTVLLLANGASGVSVESGIDLVQFEMALIQVCRRLAQAIVRDGEGATKFVTVNVNGATDDDAAQKVAYAIATSPLVKTAFFGQDPNWGRILAAAGRAGVPLDVDAIRLYIAPGSDAHDTSEELLLMEGGKHAGFDEADAVAVMQHEAFTVSIELGQGSGWSTIWTTDFSADYVAINADYRT